MKKKDLDLEPYRQSIEAVYEVWLNCKERFFKAYAGKIMD